MALNRITITIPDDLVTEADRKATELDRSRSWVLVDALRRYLASPPFDAADVQRVAGPRSRGLEVREPQVDYAAGLGASRTAQLEADLRLTPEERVLAAERTLLVDEQRRSPSDRILSFDRYEDYLEWRKREAVSR